MVSAWRGSYFKAVWYSSTALSAATLNHRSVRDHCLQKLLLTLLGPQSRFGGKPLIVRVLCPHIWECGAKRVNSSKGMPYPRAFGQRTDVGDSYHLRKKLSSFSFSVHDFLESTRVDDSNGGSVICLPDKRLLISLKTLRRRGFLASATVPQRGLVTSLPNDASSQHLKPLNNAHKLTTFTNIHQSGFHAKSYSIFLVSLYLNNASSGSLKPLNAAKQRRRQLRNTHRRYFPVAEVRRATSYSGGCTQVKNCGSLDISRRNLPIY